jgi:hypothetical protein
LKILSCVFLPAFYLLIAVLALEVAAAGWIVTWLQGVEEDCRPETSHCLVIWVCSDDGLVLAAVWSHETLSAGSAALAITTFCCPSGPVITPTEVTIVTVTVSVPWADLPSYDVTPLPWAWARELQARKIIKEKTVAAICFRGVVELSTFVAITAFLLQMNKARDWPKCRSSEVNENARIR